MINEKLKTLRKNKGFTQEDLASRLHVTRQTVSKWEKGYSVPDAAMLTEIAEILEVSVLELLGSEKIEQNDPDAVVDQLARINEQLAIKNRRARRIWKIVGLILILGIIVPAVSMCSLGMMRTSGSDTGYAGKTTLGCELDGESYSYSVEYDDKYRIVGEEGDSFITDNVDLDGMNDAREVEKKITFYFESRGGEVMETEVKGLEL